MGSETSKQIQGATKNSKLHSPSPEGSSKKLRQFSFRRFSCDGCVVARSQMQPLVPPISFIVDGSCCVSSSANDEQQRPVSCQSDSRLSVSHPRSRSGSTISTVSTKSSRSQSNAAGSLPSKTRQLIESCFHNPFVESIGMRILKRAAEKRKDFGCFYFAITSAQRDEIAETIKSLLKGSVANTSNNKEFQRHAIEYGQRFLQFRQMGFKADYFAALADSTITECVFLDNAVHPAHQTLSAFSQFIALIFSSVRDGFYNEKQNDVRLRKASWASIAKISRKTSQEEGEVQHKRDSSPTNQEGNENELLPQPNTIEPKHNQQEPCNNNAHNDQLQENFERFKENNDWFAHPKAINIDSKGLLMPPPL